MASIRKSRFKVKSAAPHALLFPPVGHVPVEEIARLTQENYDALGKRQALAAAVDPNGPHVTLARKPGGWRPTEAA